MSTSPADQIIRLMNGMTVSRCVMMAAHTVVLLTPILPPRPRLPWESAC